MPLWLLTSAWGLLRKHWQLALLAVVLVTGYVYINNLKAQRDAALIGKNNAEADRDSLKLVATLDSVQVYQQLAWSWGEITSLRAQISATGETQSETHVVLKPKEHHETHVDTVPPPPEESPLLTYQDSLAGPPADVFATLLVQKLADSTVKTEWAWLVKPWPITLTIDVGCQDRLKPDVLVSAPPWVVMDSVTTKVKTKVCGSPTKKHGFGWWLTRATIAAGVGVAAGVAASQ